MRKLLFLMLLVLLTFPLNAHAYSKGARLVDLDPFVVSAIIDGRIAYTMHIEVRLKVSAEGEKDVRYNIARIRNNLFYGLGKYINSLEEHKDMDYAHIKSFIRSSLQRTYGADKVQDVLISAIYPK